MLLQQNVFPTFGIFVVPHRLNSNQTVYDNYKASLIKHSLQHEAIKCHKHTWTRADGITNMDCGRGHAVAVTRDRDGLLPLSE